MMLSTPHSPKPKKIFYYFDDGDKGRP